ncbi:hypothetical protein CYMTET_30606 [Cymbomonas tetramitiformis]|uniref:Uncharacterized protein n=1 Tax=Cymbomonas tetramitiformis TaxID=36881 RepID=A0AAE0FJ36_9CHLO|nr:hypothetical protein CYMTET_30606 [Cymbomonas tetramitiformis]
MQSGAHAFLELDYLCAAITTGNLRSHCARTVAFLRGGKCVDADQTDRCSIWWAGRDALARSRADANGDDARTVLVAHDIHMSTQIKMYGRVPWDWLLACARDSFAARLGSTCRHKFGNVPRHADAHRVSLAQTPSVCYHVVRDELDPIVSLLLDFDFEVTADWQDARSPEGPVARAVRAIEHAWRGWFPGCEAHVLLLETYSDGGGDSNRDKPSVHGYLFETLPDRQNRDAFWPFTGPVFANKRACMAFYTSYLHPLLRSDPYFAARGLVPEKFLDCVAGHTARAVGMAKTGSAGSKHPRYSRLRTPMALSSPMALRVYRQNPVYFTGRMLGLFVDTPISTFTCEGRGDDVRHLMRLSDIVARASELVYPALSTTGGPERSLPRDTATQRERTRQVARVDTVTLELRDVLLRAYRACLRVIEVRDDVVDRMQLDTRRLRVNMDETGAVVASVLVYQRADCNFCPIRDCTIVHSDAQRRVPLRAVYDGTRTGRAEDGHRRGDAAKMYIVYQLLPRFPTVIRHHCWKCKSTGDAASKHGVVVGVMTPRMTADVLNAVANCVPAPA